MSDNDKSDTGLQVISPVFREGAAIPPQYTCKGQGVNPPLNIFNVPPASQSLALILHDPDAVSGDYVHWLVWDIPASTETIAVNSVPVGAVQGVNDSGKNGYTGPCPPKGTGTHRYLFEVYALDISPGLPSGADRQQLQQAIEGHILAQAILIGTFSAEP